MKVAKKIIYYLKSTIDLGLIYNSYLKDEKKTKAPITSFLLGLIGYGDSNYTGDFGNKKSVMKYCYFINREVVSWCSKKQRIVSKSIIQAKYIAFEYIAQ